LVITLTGGTKGGGTIVTSEGELAIINYKKIQEKFSAFCEAQTKELIF